MGRVKARPSARRAEILLFLANFLYNSAQNKTDMCSLFYSYVLNTWSEVAVITTKYVKDKQEVLYLKYGTKIQMFNAFLNE